MAAALPGSRRTLNDADRTGYGRVWSGGVGADVPAQSMSGASAPAVGVYKGEVVHVIERLRLVNGKEEVLINFQGLHWVPAEAVAPWVPAEDL